MDNKDRRFGEKDQERKVIDMCLFLRGDSEGQEE